MNAERIEEGNYENGKRSVEDEGRTASPAWCELEIPLGVAAETFRLQEAVCSHGLFMMAPNYWDPLSNTLTRPLRLTLADDDDDSSSSASSGSLIVNISQPPERQSCLIVRVHDTQLLSPPEQQALTAQVSRMLRLSQIEEKTAKGFKEMWQCRGDDQNRSFSGRIFRSPTLFEDMVKCLLLCNCQWSRTLSMAQALCELQSELQNGSPPLVSVVKGETEDFIPKTPASTESRRKHRRSGVSKEGKLVERKLEFKADGNLEMDQALATSSNSTLAPNDGNACQDLGCCPAAIEQSKDDSFLQFSDGEEYFANSHIGNFPSPKELANLGESFLAKRCKLGYRAGRILKLARAIVEGRIRLRQLEELSEDANLSNYNRLADQLKEIEGFGPFTRANVLMCMGYYHVIPADSETIRHLKQVHSIKSTSQTMQKDIEEVYGKYEPYQFLAYWSEIWDFYERRFGKINQMARSDYKLMTASNMRLEGEGTRKRKRTL